MMFENEPDGMLWIVLIQRNEPIARELGLDVWEWLHRQIEHYRLATIDVERDKHRKGLWVVQ